MFNQKGQILIILLVLIIVAFILYANFSDRSLFKSFLPSSTTSTPSKGTKISAPAKQEKKLVPAPNTTTSPSPTPSTGPDTTPPKRLNSQPKDKSILPPETRKITLGLQTDEKAACRYSIISGMDFNSMQNAFPQAGTTTHSALVTTLNEGEGYQYYIRCKDEQGNKNTDDFTVSFSVAEPADKTPPVLFSPSHQGDVLAAGTKELVISISTDEPASCRYSNNAGTAYGSMSGSFSYYDQTKKFHTKNITGLESGKAYNFFARCQDLKGNSNTGDVMISFSVR